MRAAQICALKRDGRVIGFEAEPFSLDEAGYATHKGGFMEYSAISRFVVVGVDKTGPKPARCHANIPMSDVAYIHLKLMHAIRALEDYKYKQELLKTANEEMTQEQFTALTAEVKHPPLITLYNQESKILNSCKDANGRSLIYSISLTCDPARNMPFIFSVGNFYSLVTVKQKGTMTYSGQQFNKSNIRFYATEPEMVNVIERMYEFARDHANNTFTTQLSIMQKLNFQEKQAFKENAEYQEREDESADMPEESQADESNIPAASNNAEPSARTEKTTYAAPKATSIKHTPLPKREQSIEEVYNPDEPF